MERLCCPFLTRQLSTSGNHADCLLKLSGPAGVKALLEAEFPADDRRIHSVMSAWSWKRMDEARIGPKYRESKLR
jgi:hypothetical protein